jgi:DNA recombination protein RmuC
VRVVQPDDKELRMTFTTIIVAVLAAIVSGLVAFLYTLHQSQLDAKAANRDLADVKTALSSAEAAFAAREQELRKTIEETRQREADAKTETKLAEARLITLNDDLNAAIELKGKFQNEATRVDETRAELQKRVEEIDLLNKRINTLDIQKAEAVKDAQAAHSNAIDLVSTERKAQAEIIRAKDEQIAKLNDFITRAREVLSTEFKALSADALKNVTVQLVETADGLIKKHGEKTTADVELHQKHIEKMLGPVEETIKRLDKHVEDSNLARSKAEALLDEQVKRLAGASESLTNALRKPVIRGSWGEMTLENALESAGLEAEIDFVLQHSTDAEDGKKRTDAIINLPKGRKLIIDSKNLMETYIPFAGTDDERQKAIFAEVHSKSLSGHIKSLSSKEYWRRYEGLDCVILFIPHDGMYHAAIRDEAELIRDACEKRVFIANPMSLIPLLKAIRYVLDQDRLNKSAAEISKVGTDLYGDIFRFSESMARIGNRLKLTVSAYNDAIPGLDRFIISKSRSLKQLGASKGAEPELPEAIDEEPRLFSSRELRESNFLVDNSDN